MTGLGVQCWGFLNNPGLKVTTMRPYKEVYRAKYEKFALRVLSNNNILLNLFLVVKACLCYVI